MKTPVCLLALFVAAIVCLSACQRISLSKGGKSGGGGQNPVGSLLGGGDSQAAQGPQPPPLDGDWTVTYQYKDNQFDSTVTFSQKGKQLAGQGNDQAGAFFISGTVDGKQVHFTKKYTDNDPSKQPIDYTGELSYEDDSDYKGWTIAGHYKASVNGKQVDDKWVAIGAAAPQTAEQPPQQDQQPDQQADQQQQPVGPPDSVAGTWRCNYDYNFKRLDTRLFLKQRGNELRGDGVDTNPTKEDTWFKVTKGWYNPPRVMIFCHYEKGNHSPVTRDIVVKAQIQPDGHIKGETQYGSEWNAYSVH